MMMFYVGLWKPIGKDYGNRNFNIISISKQKRGLTIKKNLLHIKVLVNLA